MKYVLEYSPAVLKEDIPKLGKVEKEQIKKAIEEKLSTAPERFGKPLRKSLKGYLKLRVGDYRVIFGFQKNTVQIFAIVHRSIVYEKALKRI